MALLSFVIALSALGWQIAKHLLDGGRVKVYLNTAVWEPEVMVATTRSGKFTLSNQVDAAAVVRGRALEVAQLVVENPGRIPVTIYSPGIAISGHGKHQHSITPRLFDTNGSFGADDATTKSVVRLESYARVTFLLDYWSAVPRLLQEAPRGRVDIRGFVGVAGRTRRPQKSNRRLRWRIHEGQCTAIPSSPKFTPYAVIWREFYRALPEHEDKTRRPNAGPPITRGIVGFILEEAMSRFDERPDLRARRNAIEEIAREQGYKLPVIGSILYGAYRVLDRMDGHLTAWGEGIIGAENT